MTCKDKKERKRPCAAYRNVLHKVLNRQLFFVRSNLGAHPDVVVRFLGGEPTHAAWMQSVLLHSAFRRFLRDSFVGVPFKNNPIVNLREFSLCRKGKFPEICYFYTPESSID